MLGDVVICPKCKAKMKAEHTLSVSKLIQHVINVICNPLTKTYYVCTNLRGKENWRGIANWNEKYSKDLNEIKKEVGAPAEKYVKKCGFKGSMSDLKKMFGADKESKAFGLVNLKIPVGKSRGNKSFNIPPEPPKRIVCDCHYDTICAGDFNERVKKVHSSQRLLFIKGGYGWPPIKFSGRSIPRN